MSGETAHHSDKESQQQEIENQGVEMEVDNEDAHKVITLILTKIFNNE